MADNEQDIAQIHLDKGKGRERDSLDQSNEPGGSFEHLDNAAYPPAAEDMEDSRRVQENLRRWEVAERQRRKAARESQSSTGPSLVTDVSRRASLLWPGRKSKHPSISKGGHTALESQDNIDSVPLTHINLSPTPSPTRSNSEDTSTQNPFANPPEVLSPFDDVHASQQPKSLRTTSPQLLGQSRGPASSSGPPAVPPPPLPINLPPPRSPPPITTVPPPILQSDSTTKSRTTTQEPEIRWWHDWLCGCGEGPDRGGDYQAGRTNPME